jgi:hypothetical protein
MQQARELLAPVYGWFTEGFENARSERGECATRWNWCARWSKAILVARSGWAIIWFNHAEARDHPNR